MPKRIASDTKFLQAFQKFDELPNSAFVRLPVLESLFSCSAATIWRRVADQRLPKPQKLSNRITAWNVGQLRDSLATVMGERSDP